MTRSGYSDDFGCGGPEEMWANIRYRGAVKSAIRGKRGQRLLRNLRDALDAMPVKELIEMEMQAPSGAYCALGALAAHEGRDLKEMRFDDETDAERIAEDFDVATSLIREIVFENDDDFGPYTKDTAEVRKRRWKRVRSWVESQIRERP